ncbi:hypothetical protein FALBO_4232 [Fusarium albosuccineum]|uniref:Uncharacterized protein n=1 Tax=Fusarium albosuccineum TaxID=1237068 RepID=A0A8H4LJ91_9HYPO|nr:hypothetical protein FALBO_4232 [Fusarium albosuccineum]
MQDSKLQLRAGGGEPESWSWGREKGGGRGGEWRREKDTREEQRYVMMVVPREFGKVFRAGSVALTSCAALPTYLPPRYVRCAALEARGHGTGKPDSSSSAITPASAAPGNARDRGDPSEAGHTHETRRRAVAFGRTLVPAEWKPSDCGPCSFLRPSVFLFSVAQRSNTPDSSKSQLALSRFL